MIASNPRRVASQDVSAEIVYAEDNGEKLVVENYGPQFRFTRSTGTDERRTVSIRDARRAPEPWSLDGNGFVLLEHRSAVDDFFDAQQVQAVYYRELEGLIARATGAVRVVMFNHFLRFRDEAEREAKLASAPIFAAHADYTPSCGPGQVRSIVPGEAERVLAGRYAIIQAWQPILRPALGNPLAVADARSVAAEDMLRTERRLQHHVRHIYRLRYRPEHRWFYFPAMQPDEVLLFKSYDSLTDGRARLVFHATFEHPGSPSDAPPRQSIDSRALAIFAGPADGFA